AWAVDTGADGHCDTFGATPGGEQQVAWNAQVLARLLTTDRVGSTLDTRQGQNAQGALDASNPLDALDALGGLLVAPRWSVHGPDAVTTWADDSATAVRPAHVVVRSPAPGTPSQLGDAILVGAADPRLGATVVGV
nr:hypothetical protein [Micromonospora sp. DSM 115978]